MDQRYEKFLAVVRAGSFTAAAKQLHVTQPAITMAVASLERSLGVALYQRGYRTLVLTRSGAIVAHAAAHMAEQLQRMHSDLRSGIDAVRPRVGMIDSIARLLSSAPDGDLYLQRMELVVDNSERIISGVADGSLMFGIITAQRRKPSGIAAVRPLPDEEFVFVAAPGKAVTSERLPVITDWLATNPASTSYAYFTSLFAARGMQVRPIFHSTSMELLQEMAERGKGTALLPRHVVQRALSQGRLRIIPTEPLYRPLWALGGSMGLPADIDDLFNATAAALAS